MAAKTPSNKLQESQSKVTGHMVTCDISPVPPDVVKSELGGIDVVSDSRYLSTWSRALRRAPKSKDAPVHIQAPPSISLSNINGAELQRYQPSAKIMTRASVSTEDLSRPTMTGSGFMSLLYRANSLVFFNQEIRPQTELLLYCCFFFLKHKVF